MSGSLEPTTSRMPWQRLRGSRYISYGTNFTAVMSTNLYGPGDNFYFETSHVLPALIRKFHEAKANGLPEVVVWGTGKPRREFLHVDDLADACVFLMQQYDGSEIINVAVGEDISIGERATMVMEVVGCQGRIIFDPTKPDGTLWKLLDTSRLQALGWAPHTGLREGRRRIRGTLAASSELESFGDDLFMSPRRGSGFERFHDLLRRWDEPKEQHTSDLALEHLEQTCRLRNPTNGGGNR